RWATTATASWWSSSPRVATASSTPTAASRVPKTRIRRNCWTRRSATTSRQASRTSPAISSSHAGNAEQPANVAGSAIEFLEEERREQRRGEKQQSDQRCARRHDRDRRRHAREN